MTDFPVPSSFPPDVVTPAPVQYAPDDDELVAAVHAARRAAYGDSNDLEIELLQDALDLALSRLGVQVRPLTDEEIEEAEDELP